MRNELTIPLRHVAANLRHEILPVLAIIVSEANKIDKSISRKAIDIDSPASKILGATMIVDHFIQMITGVTEFNPRNLIDRSNPKPRSLSNIIRNYFAIYSLLRNSKRAESLTLQMGFGREVFIDYASEVIEYLFALLLDNAWKYSSARSLVKIDLAPSKDGMEGAYDIALTSIGRHLPRNLDIFAKGTKANRDTPGFGYGLHWATLLVRQYNAMRPDLSHISQLVYESNQLDHMDSSHTFTLTNVLLRITV